MLYYVSFCFSIFRYLSVSFDYLSLSLAIFRYLLLSFGYLSLSLTVFSYLSLSFCYLSLYFTVFWLSFTIFRYLAIPRRRGSRPVYQVCANLSDFFRDGSTLNNSHNIFILTRWLVLGQNAADCRKLYSLNIFHHCLLFSLKF